MATAGKLGWVRGPEDPRTLKLTNYTTPTLPPPPASVNWMRQVTTWPMYSNDRIGACVPITCAHLIRGWTRYAGGTEVEIPESEVIGAYSAISGYDPLTGFPDSGCRSLDALNHWRKVGIGGRRIVAYVRLDHRDDTEVRTATNLFGGLFIGAQMPIDADRQFQQGQTWTPTRGTTGRRGSWGGHAMHLGAYTARSLTVSTWGRPQRMTWHWWDSYVAEAYAVVSEDWLDRAGGRSPLGFDLAGMLSDLRRVTA